MARLRATAAPPVSQEWERAKAILAQATGLTSDERQRVLDASFPQDAALRDELLKLLNLHDTAMLALGQPSSSDALSSSSLSDHPDRAPTASVPLLETGTTCGPYRVLKQLGAGGMGQVFLAEDVRLGRRVALKSLAGRWLDSPTSRQRLLYEARMAAALSHSHIATLYDVLEDDGRLLLVMEYVEGRTLHAMLQSGPLSIGHALRLAVQIADAVSYAHDRGILHCDLKPANVQVALDGSAKVLDFGLAWAKHGSEMWGENVAPPGSRLGTPSYMAPERLGRGAITASGDVYSLGVIVFELITRRRPFEGTALSGLILDVLGGQPPKPSALVPGVPAALDEVVDRALAKDPALRYQSAREMSQALQAVLAAVEPRPVSGLIHFLTGFVTTLAALTLAGWSTSLFYSFRLGLGGGDFATESALQFPYWGFRSMILPLGVVTLVAILYSVASLSCQLAFTGSERLRRWCAPLLARLNRTVERVRSTPIDMQMQVILWAHIITLALLVWGFGDLIAAVADLMLPSGNDLAALGPAHAGDQRLYRQLLSIELFVFGAAWYRLLLHRYERRVRTGLGTLTGGVAVTALTVVLLAMPFRLLYHNGAERVSYQSQPCYIVGQRGEEVLLFCALQRPSRNPLVRLDDPALKREQVYENIFTELGRPHSYIKEDR